MEKSFRKTAFSLLLKMKPYRGSNPSQDGEAGLSVMDRLFGECFSLAAEHRHGEAAQLWQLANSLLDPGPDEPDPTAGGLSAVLTLLLLLKNSSSAVADNSHRGLLSETKSSFLSLNSVNPQDNIAVGIRYPTFSPADFLPPASSGTTLTLPYRHAFSAPYRHGAGTNGVPGWHKHHAGGENTTESRLVKKGQHETSLDDGYSSPTSLSSEPVFESLWDRVWEVEVPQLRTWESLGNKTVQKERPYITDMRSPLAVHHTWQVCMGNLRLICPAYSPAPLRVVPEQTLCLHVVYLLAGIPTDTFPYNNQTRSFELLAGTSLPGLTPETVSAACQDYIAAANIFTRLHRLASNKDESSTGLILRGFCSGLNSFLKVFSSSVIHMGNRFSQLGDLDYSLRPLLQQIVFLGSICSVSGDSYTDDSEQLDHQLPGGVELLSHLLEVSVRISSCESQLLLISLLKATVLPYLRFLRSWLFFGEYSQSFEEFGLTLDTRYINIRDVRYWNYGFGMREPGAPEAGATGNAFLSDIQAKVFSTGKSLCLLRLICPSHYLAGKWRESQPALKLAVTAEDQIQLRQSCEKYVLELREAERQVSFTLGEKRKRVKEKREEDARLMRKKFDEDQEMIRKQLEERREEQARVKRERYEDLMCQAQAARRRKEEERREKELREEEIGREAERLGEEVRAREEEDNRRIQEFYRRLELEAEGREKRAKWKMSRNHPEIKAKRILLQRKGWGPTEGGTDNSTNKLKHTSPRSATPIREKSVEERTALSQIDNLTNLRIGQDEMGNLTVSYEDQEGNSVSSCLSLAASLTLEDQNRIQATPFHQLPDEMRHKILLSLSLPDQFEIPKLTGSKDGATVLARDAAVRTSDVSNFKENKKNNQSSIASLLQDVESIWDTQPAFDPNGNPALDSPDGSGGMPRKTSDTQKIERVLYPSRYNQNEETFGKVSPVKTNIVLRNVSKAMPYKSSFPELISKKEKNDEFSELLGKMEKSSFAPLSLILQSSLLIPLRAQKKLVDAALLSEMLVNFKLDEHFHALRRYFFLADGEFGRQLVISLCQWGKDINRPTQLAGELLNHLFCGSPAPLLLCPTSLNRVLESAISASLVGSCDPLAENLSFVLRGEPLAVDHSAAGLATADRAEAGSGRVASRPGGMVGGVPGLCLSYHVSWPLNIVLSEETIEKYSKVLDFMICLRTAIVTLEVDWAHQNLVLRRDKKSWKGQQLHRIHIMRHEMLNFLRNLHAYVSTQVLEVSWTEFQDYLLNKVENLDDLINYHSKYLNRVIFRCLLNEKASPVMRIIMDTFSAIIKFSNLVSNCNTSPDRETWQRVTKQYGVFKKSSRMVFTVVSKLSARGYQPHLQDLLMRLNFNDFYDKPGAVSSGGSGTTSTHN